MPEKASTLPTKPRPAILKWIPLITVIAVCLFFRPQIRAWMAARGGLHLSAPLWAVGASLVPWLLLGIYWELANVRANGFVHGGPMMMTGAMAGLFGGGLVALVVLILLLQRR